MAQGYKDFTAGAILTAADLEDYNQNQSIMRFASAAARDAALSVVKTEGMRAYLIDVNCETVYSGSLWSTIGPVHGALSVFDPVITQGVTVAHTVGNSTWSRVGRQVTWRWTLIVTGSGTASNVVTLQLPVNINYVSDYGPCGHFQLWDNSATLHYSGPATGNAGGSIKGCVGYPAGSGSSGGPTFLGLASFTAGLAANDILAGWVTYEAAADA